MNWRCRYVYFAQKIQWVVENVLLWQGNWCIQSQLVWKNYIENPVHKNISLAVIDINNLKRVNDSNGHFAGDELIKKINDKLSQYATVVRWGGDEFFCIIDAEKEQEFENFCKSQKEFAYAYKFNFDKVDIGNVAEQLDELMYKCKRIQKSENENK